MALIKCPECKQEVSDKATACPGCGFAKPKRQEFGCGTLILAGIIIVVFTSMFKSCFGNDDQYKNSSSPIVTPAAAPTADPQMQAQRQEFIRKQIESGIFQKIEIPGNLPHLWVTPRFKNLDFDTKKKFVSVVYAYYISQNPSFNIVVLYDSQTGKKTGQFSEQAGQLELKE
jgi:hypothetical protein